MTDAPNALPFGTFEFDAVSGRLTWSDELFVIFGFTPAEVVPTVALMASHQHPQDRADWQLAWQESLDQGRPINTWHRVLDAKARTRTVHTAGVPVVEAGQVLGMRGVITDLTERLRRDRAEEVAAAVAKAGQTRAVIDQAKGILMATLDLDEEQSFDLLRWHSSHSNAKVRDIAASVIDQLADPETAGIPPRQRLVAILDRWGPARPPLPDLPTHRSQPRPPADQAENVAGRIPAAALARTLVGAVAAAGISITIADCQAPDWPLVYANQAFEKLTGYPIEQILGRNCRFLQGPGTDPTHTAAIRDVLTSGDEIRIVLRNYRRDGTPFWNDLHLSAVRNLNGALTHYIGYQSDVTERIQREHQLEHLAYHDPVSSLPNLAAAIRHLDAAIATATPETTLHVLHVAMAGLPADDSVDPARTVRDAVIGAAQRLRAAVPGAVFVAHLDHLGFLVVTDGLPPDLRKALANGFGDAAPVAVSTGYAHYPGDGGTAKDLIAMARTNNEAPTS